VALKITEVYFSFACRFDDDSNKDINSSIIRSVMAVAHDQDPQYDITLIKRKGIGKIFNFFASKKYP